MSDQTTRDRARDVMITALAWYRDEPGDDADAILAALDAAGIGLYDKATARTIIVQAYDALSQTEAKLPGIVADAAIEALDAASRGDQ